MSSAISTKFLSATNNRGTRVKAWVAQGASVTVPYDYELDEYTNHARAAEKLARKLRWAGTWHGGEVRSCHVFVRVGGETFIVEESLRTPE